MNNVAAAQPAAPWFTVERLVNNARRVGKESQHVVMAAYLVIPGRDIRSLCCSCADKHLYSPVYRLPKGGECQECTYVGYDCLVVVVDDETA